MTKDEALERLDAINLTGALYRTARRILDRVHEDNGYVRIDYPQARAICVTESDETVRGHLARLTAAGLFTCHRNDAIHIYWCGWNDEDPDAVTGKTARGRAEITQPRAVLPEEETENEEPVYIVTTTNVVVDNNNNNCDSSSSSAPTAPEVTEPQTPEPQQPEPSPAVSAIDPADWARVRAVYESDFGLFTSLLVERVQDALRQHSAEMVILAMGRAVSANKRRWDYVDGILRNWSVEGYGNAGAKNAPVGSAADGRGTGRAGGAAGANSARRQEAPVLDGLREFLIATGQVPAGQAAG